MSAPDDADKAKPALLEKLAAQDVATLARFVAWLDKRSDVHEAESSYLQFLRAVSDMDVQGLRRAERSYGNSWKQRGGVDTYHMLRRKWERIENKVAQEIAAQDGAAAAEPFDILEHLTADRTSTGLIDDVRDLRRYLMLVDAEQAARARLAQADSGRGYLDELPAISAGEIAEIEAKEAAYGASWKRAGGIGAFMMLARKWDRIVQRVKERMPAQDGRPSAARENIFEHILADARSESLLDDTRDLRRYLILVEAEMAARGVVKIGTARDDSDGPPQT